MIELLLNFAIALGWLMMAAGVVLLAVVGGRE